MFEQMMEQCCGEDGKPDFDRMKQFMEHHDRTNHLDSIGWALFFIWVGVSWLAGLLSWGRCWAAGTREVRA